KLADRSAEVGAVALSPDGATLAVACQDRTLTLWDLGKDQPPRPLQTARDPVLGLAFAADGKTLAAWAGPSDHRGTATVLVWDVATRDRLVGFEAGRLRFSAFHAGGGPALAPDGGPSPSSRAAAASRSGCGTRPTAGRSAAWRPPGARCPRWRSP